MKEAHMAVVATLLDRAIVVYDDRDRKSNLPGFMVLYSPGYTPFKAIGKVQARELANKRDDTHTVALLAPSTDSTMAQTGVSGPVWWTEYGQAFRLWRNGTLVEMSL